MPESTQGPWSRLYSYTPWPVATASVTWENKDFQNSIVNDQIYRFVLFFYNITTDKQKTGSKPV